MKEAIRYRVTLKDGTSREVTRMEDENKNLIGLWAWSLKQMAPIIISFEECSVLSDYIAMIDKLGPQEEYGFSSFDSTGEAAGERLMTPDEWEEEERQRILSNLEDKNNA